MGQIKLSYPTPVEAAVEVLVARQLATTGDLFASTAESLDFNAASPDPSTETKYSIMGQVPGMLAGAPSGALRWRLVWLGIGEQIQWDQTDDPLDGTAATFSNVVKSDPAVDADPLAGGEFAGYSLTTGPNADGGATFCGAANRNLWFFASGVRSLWTHGGATGFPAWTDDGGDHQVEQVGVELYARGL